jgi:hypothetical protein
LEFHSGRETDHSPPSRAEVKEWAELYLHSPNTPSLRGGQLGGAQGQGLRALTQVKKFQNVTRGDIVPCPPYA